MEQDNLFREPTHKNSEERPPGFFSRAGRRILHVLGYPTEPFVPLTLEDIAEITPEEWFVDELRPDAEAAVKPAAIEPEDTAKTGTTRVVVLARDGKSLHIFDQNNNPQFPEITPEGSVSLLFGKLSRMYMGSGEGNFSDTDVAANATSSTGKGYAYSTLVRAAVALHQELPNEIFSYDGRTIAFGDISLASSVLDSDEIDALSRARVASTREELISSIDSGKEDIISYDHAIIRQAERAYFVSLQSPEGIMTARVIDALTGFEGEKISSTEISRGVWNKMTTSERELFVDNEEFALSSDESSRIELQTLMILRRLTHKMFLSHERYGDSFTLTTAGLTVEYHKELQNEKELAAIPNLRPILTPGEKELVDLTDDRKRLAIDAAQLYMSHTRARARLSQPDSIAMLSFIMSPTGWWATKQACDTGAPYRKAADALRYMHKQLKRNLGYAAYTDAFQNRLISGNRVVKRRHSGQIRQVGGRLPGSSDWSIGQNMQSILSRYVRDNT